MSLHLELAEALGTERSDVLTAPPECRQDALILHLANGFVLTVRYAAANAYSLRWTDGRREAGIDTAPLHPQLATFPNHLHGADGMLHADPLTRIDAAPLDNLRSLIAALLAGSPASVLLG